MGVGTIYAIESPEGTEDSYDTPQRVEFEVVGPTNYSVMDHIIIHTIVNYATSFSEMTHYMAKQTWNEYIEKGYKRVQ